MANYVKFHQFNEDLGLGVHNLNTDTLKVCLSNTAPTVATNALKADLTAITEEHGYTPVDIQNTYSQTSGTGTLAGVDVTITSASGTVGPFRYAVLYNDSTTVLVDPLICYWDYGSSITLADAESFLIDFGASIFTLE